MARPPRFTPDGILDAAAVVAARRWRSATVADVAKELDTPPNSIYYRFPTKDALFGSLWMRSVGRFHVGFLEALGDPDPSAAAEAAARHIPRFCHGHPLDANAMTLYRQGELVERLEGESRDRVARINDDVVSAMVELTNRRFGRTDGDTLALMAVACQESPYGLVRRYVRSGLPMPPWLEDAAGAASLAILALADPPARLDTQSGQG